jgi:hypothetical protein
MESGAIISGMMSFPGSSSEHMIHVRMEELPGSEMTIECRIQRVTKGEVGGGHINEDVKCFSVQWKGIRVRLKNKIK